MTSSTYQLRCYRACTLPQFNNASSRRATTLLSPTTSTASSKVCFRRSTWYSTARSNCSRSQWFGSSKAATSRARTYVQNIEDWDDVNNAIASISDVLYGPKQQRTSQRFSGKTVPRRKPIDSKRRNNTSTWKLDSRPQHTNLKQVRELVIHDVVSTFVKNIGSGRLFAVHIFAKDKPPKSVALRGASIIRSNKTHWRSLDENVRVFSLSADSNLHLFHTLRFY